MNLTGGTGGAGSTTIKIIPYALGDTDTSITGVDANFVTHNIDSNGGTNGIVLASGEYATSITNGATSTNNVRLSGNSAVTSTSGTTVNSLWLGSGGRLLQSVNGAIFTVTSGAVGVFSGNNGITSEVGQTDNSSSRQFIIPSTIEGFIHAVGNLAMWTHNTGSGSSLGLTKDGPGTLSFTSSNNDWAGTTTINNGFISALPNQDLAPNSLNAGNNIVIQPGVG